MTASSTLAVSLDRQNHAITELLEPAMDCPPSPEGIRAFGRRMKRGSIAEQHNNEQTVSSSSSSLRSDTPEIPWERGPDNGVISRNPSLRASALPTKDRPESVQLFAKSVFSRRPRLRREQSEQSPLNNSICPNEASTDANPDPAREQRFIHSMFTRRNRGASEVAQRKVQISGPYDFQHVSHSSKENMAGLERLDRNEPLTSFPGTRPRTTTASSVLSIGLSSVNKPLPAPPASPCDTESISPRGSIQMSPPRLPKSNSDEILTSQFPLPPRTSSHTSVRHDRTDSFNANSISNHQAQPIRNSPTDGSWPIPSSHASNAHSEQRQAGNDERRTHSSSPADEPGWPLTTSVSSLPQVPEEEESPPTNTSTRPGGLKRTPTLLRGSISVPQLRRISLCKTLHRSPSNASETLGTYGVATTQRHFQDFDDIKAIEDDLARGSWEDDIDYCYDHAAEADCDFAWERPSCDIEREDCCPESPILSHGFESVSGRFGLVPPMNLSNDVPGLSPTSNGSASTQTEASTPTNPMMLSASNFSLPKLDTTLQLNRGDALSRSSVYSYQGLQEFNLSPSLLIPDEYHERMLQLERGDLSLRTSSSELNLLQHYDRDLKFGQPGIFVHPRSSASTMSTLSEHSGSSSRYPSPSFTRWTGSSTSSWQTYADSNQSGGTTPNEKEHVVSPLSDTTVVNTTEITAFPVPKGVGRDAHGRAFSEANVLLKMKALHDTVAHEVKTTPESPKAHRRTRTASKSHANGLPQFALFPQVSQRSSA
ncbi:hypothetical protein GGS21DRAFT_540177 [Xylaria nigripes]|nr:hypothetical protein GGS21DRAFT_540177 [Xylaria nigripes]